MQEQHNDEETTLEPRNFSGILSGLKQLTNNVEELHRTYCIYGATMWGTVGTCFPPQVPIVCTIFYPVSLFHITCRFWDGVIDSGLALISDILNLNLQWVTVGLLW